MNVQNLKEAQANLDLILLNAEANSISSSDLYLWLRESGLPSEIAIRLKNLVDVTAKTAEDIISVGKIILVKIIEFIKAHPNLAIGVALGAAIGALVSMIPFLGTYLAPIAALLGITIGAVAGHRLDLSNEGKPVSKNPNLISITQELIEIAKEFFKLLIDIFNTVFGTRV